MPPAGDARVQNLTGDATVTVPCPVLIGRSTELEALVAALDAACKASGSLVFVVGEAGIGKSRLVREVAARAVPRGVRLLRGRAVPGSGGSAFRPVAEALAPLAELAADAALAPWVPALRGIVPTVALAPAVESSPPLRSEAVLRLLAAAGAQRGALVVLEDLHWADPETVSVVEHLSDNLERARVLCLVTVRDEPSGARDLVHRVAARRTGKVIQLARLNTAQTAAMVHSCTGGSNAEAVTRAVALADGVPFVIEELLLSPGLPATVAEGVHARLSELDERHRAVLVAAAAFGRHFDWRLLGRAAGVPERDVVDALERGVATQLLAVEGDGFCFRHALTAAAVFQSEIPPRRQAVAAAALGALDAAHEQLPSELREMAARVAELAGQRHRAGLLHLALGDEAVRRGGLHTAVAALRRAVELLAGSDADDLACERLIDALVLAGRVDDALALGETLVRRLPDERAAAVHLRLAGAAAAAARWTVATTHLAAARSRIGGARSPGLRCELAIREAEVALGTNRADHAVRRAQDALDTARAEGLAEHECEVLQLLGRCARRSSLASAERWFRAALEAAEAHGLALWRLRSMHELGTIALLERSEVDMLLAAQRLAETLGAMATAAVLDIEIAAGYGGVDDFDGTARHGEQAVRRGGELGLDLIVAFGWMHVATAAALRGNDERAATAREAAMAAAPGSRDIEGFVVAGQLLAALANDDLERALDLASRTTDILRGSETAPPAHHRAAWPALLALFHRPEAVPAIEEIEQAGCAVNPAARGWLDLARAIVEGRTDRERAAAAAIEADAAMAHLPMWQSIARRIAAQAAADDGWQIPGHWLREAEACLRRLGFSRSADSCRRLRGASVQDMPPAWPRLGITRREADVLALVIDGLSNREIADRLYLSVRTVEKHVESLLRKTATRTRTQLARVTAPT